MNLPLSVAGSWEILTVSTLSALRSVPFFSVEIPLLDHVDLFQYYPPHPCLNVFV